MPIELEERPVTAVPVCAADGMPLYSTIVGLRCALCGAATPH